MSAAALVSAFRADAPRPPVPGEEGERCHHPQAQPVLPPHAKGQRQKGQAGRREDDELGQAEGSDSPLSRWTKSLHSLLGDQDGAHLFRAFLEREQRVDALDFWFACNGFRQMDMSDHKSVRVARAIHKRYVESSSVAAQLKAATRSYIKDTIRKQQIDSAMFDQAQTEVQALMEENCYQMFLASDIYLQYVRSGGENPLFHGTTSPLGPLQLVCGYLPTLNEEEEWVCPQLRPKALAAGGGGGGGQPPVTESGQSKCSRPYGRNGYANPYHAQPGYVFAPASSANDSDVMTDDSLSMTDSSSVDGVPPYRQKKQQQREMHRSVKANGQVSLPHFPRTHRLPKEMTPVDPAAFAAQLIARLERVKRERDTVDCLEVRLEQIKEDECEEGEMPGGEGQTEPVPQHPPLSLLPPGPCDEDPQAILDDHLSRVLKTPGCQSPGLERHAAVASPGTARRGCPSSNKHVHHHYVHHHTVPKTTEQIEAEAAQWVHCLCAGRADCCSYGKPRSHAKPDIPPLPLQLLPFSARVAVARRGQAVTETVVSEGEGKGPFPTPQLPGDEPDRAQHVWQWVLESERPASKHRTHSVQCVKKGAVWDGARGAALERSSRQHQGSAHPRGSALPSHPFVQDPAMPPLPPPNTLQQLEEARRRLEEERKVAKTPKQRYCTSSLQRDRTHTAVAQGGSVSVSTSGPLASPADEHKAPRKPPAPAHPAVPTELVVTYFFCGEDIPYRRMMKGHSLTLAHFKEQLSKKGSYRYYFKRASNEFDCGAVFEEVRNDTSPLPMYEGKILGKVERID